MAQFKFEFVEDSRSLIRGTQDVERALDDVADSLDDVAREGGRSTDQLERDLRGAGDELDVMAREGQRTTERMERSFRDLARTAGRTADDVGDDYRKGYRQAEDSADRFRRAADDASDEAGRATAEFKDEARQNFSEVASSFTGEMDSAVDLVQGTLGGLAGSLGGPAGLAAGVLAGIGGAMYRSIVENAELSEERIQQMYEDMAESGLDYASQEFVIEQLRQIYARADEAVIKWEDLQRAAEATGLSQETVARAFAGDAEAAAEFNLRLTERTREQKRAVEDLGVSSSSTFVEVQGDLGHTADLWEKVQGETDTARTRAEAYRSAVDQTRAATEAAEGTTDDLYSKLTHIGSQSYKATVQVDADLAAAERAIRRWRPDSKVIQVRLGQAVQ